jgi:pyridoxine 5-phosphate synthase
MSAPPIRLGINIDHVATVRNARGGANPDTVRAAHLAVLAGADGITVHLREDRRHIRDIDVERLKRQLFVPLNLEMAATAEMATIATSLRPHAVCIVPEKREERTTEGGLDLINSQDSLRRIAAQLREAGIRVSVFVEPDIATLEAASAMGVPVAELHTGTYCEHVAAGDDEQAERELEKLRRAAARGVELGLEVHAGHGLNYETARQIAGIPQVVELNIGHFLIGEAIFVGLDEAVRTMRAVIDEARAAT